MPELNAFYVLAAIVVTVLVTEKFRTMPFLTLVLVTGLYGVAQGADSPWTAKEFNLGFSQTIAAAGLTILAAAMVARLAAAKGGLAWWQARLSGQKGLLGVAAMATISGLGGNPISALAVLTPMVEAAGAARKRIALMAAFAVNASHGCLVPSPLPIAALAILGGDWRYGLMVGVPVAVAQVLVGLVLARRCPLGAATDTPIVVAPSRRAGWGVAVVILVMIALIIGQSLAQNPAEPLGGGPIRENLLGLGRPMILLLVGLAVALAAFGGFSRQSLSETGWLAQGAQAGLGVFLAVGAAGGFQMVLHNNGMAEIFAEKVLTLSPALGIAIPFLLALVSRALQGLPLTAAITAAGMIQPLLVPLGLHGDMGRALAAVAIGAGVMAVPHVNDGYFWLASHLGGMRAAQGLRRVTGGALAQGVAALAVLSVLAAAF